MRIVGVPRSTEWCVLANWLGREREVFRGTVFACLQYVVRQYEQGGE